MLDRLDGRSEEQEGIRHDAEAVRRDAEDETLRNVVAAALQAPAERHVWDFSPVIGEIAHAVQATAGVLWK